MMQWTKGGFKISLFTTQSLLSTTLEKNPFENIVGKGENAGSQHFLLFPQCFQPIPKRISVFWGTFILSSAISFNLDQYKNLSFGKVLKQSEYYVLWNLITSPHPSQFFFSTLSQLNTCK